MVDKLYLTTSPHSKLYKLQWKKENDGLVLGNHIHIHISTSNHLENIFSEVIPMKTWHIPLDWPCQ